MNIELYFKTPADILPYYNPVRKICPDKEAIKIMILKEPTLSEEIINFNYLFTTRCLQKFYYCSISKKCHYRCDKQQLLQVHEKICTKNSHQVTLGSQKTYGNDNFVLKEIVAAGYLPFEALGFRKTIF